MAVVLNRGTRKGIEMKKMFLQSKTIARLGFFVVGGAVTAGAYGQQSLASSRFDTDTEGWVGQDFTGLCSTLTPQGGFSGSFVASGGLPGGYFTYREPASSGIKPFFRASLLFQGDFSNAYGGFLKYDRRMFPGASFFSARDVHLQGVVEGQVVTLIGDSKARPSWAWRASWVPLIEGAWRFETCEGAYATESQVRDVLANLTEVFINAEYRQGVEDLDIDNVIILGPPIGPMSTFEQDVDGWTIAGSATLSWYDSPGDSPQCIQAEDNTAGVEHIFVAPEKFSGDQSSAIGRTLELDFWASPGGSTVPDGGAPGFVRVLGANGEVLLYHNAKLPITGGEWRHHSIPLLPSPAWTRGSDQELATAEDFEQVFGNIDKLAIRGEYASGDETERLDNVVFGISTPSVVISVNGVIDSLVCMSSSLSVESVIGGEGPFDFFWQVESPENSGIYVNLADGIFTELVTGFEINVQGVGAETLDVSGFDRGDRVSNARFVVIVSNPIGSVRSNRVTVDLDCCPADLTGDGLLNFFDISAFLMAFADADPSADFTGDGLFNFFDISDFLAAFAAGCP